MIQIKWVPIDPPVLQEDGMVWDGYVTATGVTENDMLAAEQVAEVREAMEQTALDHQERFIENE